MERTRPCGVLAGAFQVQRRAGFGVRLARHRDQHGGSVFDGAAQAKPGGERDAASRGGRSIAEIENDHPETTALDQQVDRFEGVLGAVGTNPKQAVEVDAGGAGGRRVEGVFGVDQGANFLAMSGLREDGEQQTGTAGGRGSEDFSEAAAGQSAGSRVERGDAGGDALGRRSGLPVEMAAQEGFELRLEGNGWHFRFLFAFTIFLQEGIARCQWGIGRPSIRIWDGVPPGG